MGPRNVLEILQIRSLCDENEWILPILENHIVGASLQFFLKDVLGLVKAIEKSITKVLCVHKKFCAFYKNTSILNCTLTMLRTHHLNSSWRMTSFSPPRELKVTCILCGLCCHLVATIHVILQATLEFYRVFYAILSKTSTSCVALFAPVFRCSALAPLCYSNCFALRNFFYIFLTCGLCRFWLNKTKKLCQFLEKKIFFLRMN